MGARGLVVLVGMLCLGAGAPDPVEMEVGGVLPLRGGGAAVVLIDSTRSKALPIAIALALGNALPVFVARKVLDRAGMSPDALENPESTPTPSRRGPI